MRICLHQFLRPERKQEIEGCGDCLVCKEDPDNEKCKCYVPINIEVIEVKKKDEI
jgi:hypothetical protein